ncbi:MAG: GNAT family N-acetyltransferase [Victivallales bacterium]|nr:GNAT family N-acetyltransferase [Victivallales bacterium]
MDGLILHRFDIGNAEMLSLFNSLRDSMQYPLHEDALPEDAAFFMATQNGAAVARAAVVPNPHIDHATAMLGFFEAMENTAAATMLFNAIEQHCRAQGKRRVVGPINGSTWNSYRVALPLGEPFFMDVISQPYYCKLFEMHNFQTLADYFSSKSPLDGHSFERWEERYAALAERGFSIGTFDTSRTEAQLREIHALSVVGFQRNFLYTPIGEEQFMAKYLPLMAKADPKFIFLLRDGDGRLVGYHFAMRNILCREGRELVQKTIALLPELKGQGLGSLLMEHCRREAFLDGYSAVYHALMHCDNVSARINAAKQRVVRRYKLYYKEI